MSRSKLATAAAPAADSMAQVHVRRKPTDNTEEDEEQVRRRPNALARLLVLGAAGLTQGPGARPVAALCCAPQDNETDKEDTSTPLEKQVGPLEAS